MKDKLIRIYLEDGDFEYMLSVLPNRTPLHVAFGPSGAWFNVDLDAKEQLPAVELLLRMRGISNENTEGAGI